MATPADSDQLVIFRLRGALRSTAARSAEMASLARIMSKPRGDSIESSDLDVLIELDPDARFGFSYFSLPRYFEEILGVAPMW